MADRRKLEENSPLAELATPGRYGAQVQSSPGVVIGERTGVVIFQVTSKKGRAVEVAGRLGGLLGKETANRPGFWGGERQQSVVGVAPGQWLWLAEGPDASLAGSMLGEAVSGAATLCELSAAKVMIRISGRDARGTMAKGCPVDLDPSVFAPGSAATTLVDQFACQLWQVDEAPTYDLLVARSLTGSFWSWLTTSAAEFGYEVVLPRQG